MQWQMMSKAWIAATILVFLANSEICPDRSTLFRPDETQPIQLKRVHGVMFDADIHLFELTGQNQKDTGAVLTTIDKLFEQVHPGLSSYADSPEQTAESLQPLLKVALEIVSCGQCSNKLFVLRATAGLRLLSVYKA
ncbi:hypothetical protein PHET_08995 [Paragonimus heterotremus]|uniref:Uncharacterized protein n=1 Tax=Paragonimus heterotremus TaxID=100268 RepID=A0A8J4TB88_9TREM|nr:hypothetical protein PHET_08995 [Paragonimus heterotremus]